MGTTNELKKEKDTKKHVTLLSKTTLSYVFKLLIKGIRKHLEVNDLKKLKENGHSKQLGNEIENLWDKEVERAKAKNTKPSLFKVVCKMFFWSYMFGGIFMFLQVVVLRPQQSVVTAHMLGLFAKQDDNNGMEMYKDATLIVLYSLVICFMTHLMFLRNAIIGMKIRIAISSLIYRKMLKLDRESLNNKASVGYVVNLLSNDVQRFDTLTVILHYGWISPFQATIVVYYIWEQVGISSLAGVLFVILLNLPVQGYLSKVTTSLRTKMAMCTDSRIKLTGEIISGVKVIKFYAWEKSFSKMVKYIRNKELGYLKKALYLRGIYLCFMTNIQKIILFLTMLSFILLDNNLSAENVFATASYFQLIRVTLGVLFPLVIKNATETWVSIRRLEDFLQLDERSNTNYLKLKEIVENIEPDKEVKLYNVSVSFSPETKFMQDINLKVPPGALCAVVGPVGSGKSLILQLILKELMPSEGFVKVGGEVSYCPQQPWLFGSSVRNNILFGREYDKNLYKVVCKVCDLERDLNQLPQGDDSMIGESGVALSGGQKARINLARAVYRKSDIYLLDDPLSAIDAKVGNHIFKRCILQYLKGKTRILVTHQMQYLRKADMIVVMNDGKIVAQGTFKELRKNAYFENTFVDDEQETEKREKLKTQISVSSLPGDAGIIEPPVMTNQLENSTIESQNMSAFTEYIKAGGSWFVISFLVVLFAFSQMLFNGADYLLTVWSQEEDHRLYNITDSTGIKNRFFLSFESFVDAATSNWNDTDSTNANLSHYDTFAPQPRSANDSLIIDRKSVWLSIYSAFILAAVIMTLSGAFLFYKLAIRASRNLHNRMFKSLFLAPMMFFDSNQPGQILNRFSKDIGAIDEILPVNLIDTIQVICAVIGTVIMISISNYYMILLMVVAGATFMKVRNWYTTVAKEAKHLEGLTKSPMFSHISSSLNGITTIRASRAEKICRKEFDSHQDVHSSSWNLVLSCSFLFSIWLELICVCFVGCITFSFVIINQYYETVSGSWVGLAVSQSLMLTSIIQYAMRNSAETFTQMASVERVLQYTKIESEAPSETPEENKPHSKWPKRGLIEFRKLTMAFPETETIVLNDISLTIKPGEKVGICGRTGAGKSSLVSALFRLAPYEGEILIDDVDISDLGLSDIRKKISIIPQEPVLFSDTIRFNLDPYKEFEDAALWDALEQAELKESIPNLEMMISEGGSNFSVGQRQLICLARAILRNNKILVLDEATANVDPGTDALIQETIRRRFANCTVLTIAHRLNTIMDSDKVIVMDAGFLVEYDHPHLLLQDDDGHFFKMVAETGPSSSGRLKTIAECAYSTTISNQKTADCDANY